MQNNKAINFTKDWAIVIAVILLILIFTITIPNFMQTSNILNILRSISIVTIIAVGLTVSLSANGFDLSIGSTATLANSVVVSMFVWYNMPTGVSILAAVVAVVCVALFNAFLIVKVKIPDLFATLATMFIVEGLAMTYTGGGSISVGMPRLDGTPTEGTISAFFLTLSKTPWIILIMLVIVLLVHIFLTYTKHGRFIYAVGGNEEAAKLSGIPVNRYKTIAYIFSAVLAGIGGLLLASQIGSAQINAGAGYLMPAVAAAFIGQSFAGHGKPNAIGTLFGATLVGVLENGLVMLSVPYYSLNIIKGLVLALALASTYYSRKK